MLLVALAAYANSLGNGFAFDDGAIVENNPAVVEGAPVEALARTWWPDAEEGTGLYRPLTLAGFALQWRIGRGEPFVYHLVNVAGHVLVSLAVFLLLMRVGTGATGSALGAGIFAVHPVHAEAVANVVGQSEVLAALFFLAGCLLYLWDPGERPSRRIPRLLGIGLAYALSLGSKETGATLPAVLLLFELLVDEDRSFAEGVRGELPVYALLAAVFAGYAGARYLVVGSFAGEVPAPALLGLAPGERLLTALTLWPEYLRLLLFPLDLSADYGPAVLLPARGLAADVLVGGALVAGLVALGAVLRRRSPLGALALAWFGVTILPVSQIFFPAGVMLAERTLYLPSVGLSLAVAAGVAAVRVDRPVGVERGPGRDRLAGSGREGAALVAGMVVAGLLLFTRTVVRNPAWFDTYTVMQTLARDHPESARSARSTAQGLMRAGRTERAAEYYALAVELNPNHYPTLTEAAGLRGRLGDWERAKELLDRARAVTPERERAYRLLARHAIRRGRPDVAHRAATTGLLRSGSSAALWSLLSEGYALAGDLPAAVRSRQMALGEAPDSAANWERLAQLREAIGDSTGAAAARDRARRLDGSSARGRGDGVPAARRPR